jgi:hypothetical protein
MRIVQFQTWGISPSIVGGIGADGGSLVSFLRKRLSISVAAMLPASGIKIRGGWFLCVHGAFSLESIEE